MRLRKKDDSVIEVDLRHQIYYDDVGDPGFILCSMEAVRLVTTNSIPSPSSATSPLTSSPLPPPSSETPNTHHSNNKKRDRDTFESTLPASPLQDQLPPQPPSTQHQDEGGGERSLEKEGTQQESNKKRRRVEQKGEPILPGLALDPGTLTTTTTPTTTTTTDLPLDVLWEGLEEYEEGLSLLSDLQELASNLDQNIGATQGQQAVDLLFPNTESVWTNLNIF